MLIEFRIKNFRSFKDEQVFSMVAANFEKDLPENLIETTAFTKLKLLSSTAIYGANASGKTNLIKAMEFFRDFVRNSHSLGITTNIQINPFEFDDKSPNEPSEFEITFVSNTVRYRYGFSVVADYICEEWLFASPKGREQLWFERTKAQTDTRNIEYDWQFGSNLKGENRLIASLTRPNVLFLSKAADNNHPLLKPIYEWFITQIIILNTTDTVIGLALALIDTEPDIRNNVNKILSNADLSISHFEFEYDDKRPPNSDAFAAFFAELNVFYKYITTTKEDDITMVHTFPSKNMSYKLPFIHESNGTQRLFNFSAFILKALKEGQILIVDEIDASLHSILVKNIILLFNSKNTNSKGSQLIFSTHDTTLLDRDIFRRDQIWFAEKDNEGASHLYALSEFSPRKEEALQKGYLQGRYGAIPIIDDGLGLRNKEVKHA